MRRPVDRRVEIIEPILASRNGNGLFHQNLCLGFHRGQRRAQFMGRMISKFPLAAEAFRDTNKKTI
jgi:hypothetical protein